jgi:hypothetical protein
MGNLSRFRAVLPIGAAMDHIDSFDILQMGDNSEWLRAGAFVSAASYPVAASLKHLKAISFNRVTPAATGPVPSRVATNETGTFVVCGTHGQGTNVQVSTDNGNTWALANTGIPQNEFVYYLNGKFWVVGNSASDLQVSSSTTGAPGTWSAVTVDNTLTYTTGTVRMLWTGTLFVVSASAASSNAIWTSPTGAVWTARTFGTANTTPRLASVGATVVRGRGGSGFYNVSTDNGVTWGTDLVHPAPNSLDQVFALGSTFFWFDNGGNLLTTTTPAVTTSWVVRSRREGARALSSSSSLNVSATGQVNLAKDRIYFYDNQGRLVWVNEAVQWDMVYIDAARFAPVSRVVPGGSTILAILDATNYAVASCTPTTPNAVSAGPSVPTTGAYPINTYTRIK